MLFHRQILNFLEVVGSPLEPVKAEYVYRGSVQYEFGSELLQMPIALLKITNAEAQVKLELIASFQHRNEVKVCLFLVDCRDSGPPGALQWVHDP